jgi:anti-sigma regulatory factor (Ser/Thr protein kinase)
VEREIVVASRHLARGLDALEEALRAEQLAEKAVLELRLVAEEVLTNVAKYAYVDGVDHRVRVGLVVLTEEVRLEFRDHGRPFDPLSAAAPDLEADPAERPIGGLGLHLIRSLVDAAHYLWVDGANVLTLTKRRQDARDVP